MSEAVEEETDDYADKYHVKKIDASQLCKMKFWITVTNTINPRQDPWTRSPAAAAAADVGDFIL